MNIPNTTAPDWGLDEPLRFPVASNGWEQLSHDASSLSLKFYAGRDKYALAVSSRTSQLTLQKVRRLIDAFPEDFEAVFTAVEPEGWRQLYHRGTYVLECLTATRFHAEQELRRICEYHELHDDPPAEWLGATGRLEDLAAETAYALRKISAHEARAAWAILSAAQSVPLTKAEVLNCRWWSPGWLKALAASLSRSRE